MMPQDAGTGPSAARRAGLPPWLWWALAGLLCALSGGGGWWAANARGPRSVAPVEPAVLSGGAAADTEGPAVIYICSDLSNARKTTSPLLPAGLKAVHAYVKLDVARDPANLAVEWWWRGERAGTVEAAQIAAGELAGQFAVTLAPPGDLAGFGPGLGEVEIRLGGARVARGSFVVAAEAEAILAQEAPGFGETRVVSSGTGRAVGADGGLQSASQSFRGDEKVWACFEYANADPGTAFVMRWYCEGLEIEAARTTIESRSRSGVAQGWIAAGGGASLPAASYSVSLSYGSEARPLGEAKFSVVGDSGRDGQASSAKSSSSRSNSSPLE